MPMVLIDGMTFEGVATGTPIVGNGVSAHYNAGTSGKRAKVVVRRGNASGPSSAGASEGANAIVVQPGGATPAFEPVAVTPIATSRTTRCGL